MIVQEYDDKTNKTKVFQVSKSFSTVEVDPQFGRVLFLKENKTMEIVEMRKDCRYIISE
jgi:hypothetical protein